MTPAELVRRLRFPGYAVALVLIVMSLAEAVVGTWPPHPHDPFWRIAAATGMIGAVVPMLLVLFLVLALGTIMHDRLAVSLVATLCGIGALCCIVGAGVFTLDMLEVRTQVSPAMESRFTISSTWALVKIAVGAAAALMLGVSAWRTARSMNATPDHARVVRKDAAILVSSR
jgi:hypothetical protein